LMIILLVGCTPFLTVGNNLILQISNHILPLTTRQILSAYLTSNGKNWLYKSHGVISFHKVGSEYNIKHLLINVHRCSTVPL
jgi:hypothetical protein